MECFSCLFLTLLFSATPRAEAFVASNHFSRHRASPLFGISEWRDSIFDYPGTGDDRRLGTESGGAPKEICILPFPYDEVLLQGETKQLRLYEERFIKLFDCCMDNHSGVVAMGLLADSGIIQTVPLCEVEAYSRMEDFGIFVTIRVVGRAQLDEITQQTPYLKGVCRELSDKMPPNLELPNLVASNIENFMLLLSSMEHRLEKAAEESDDEDEGDSELRRRIQIAKLVSSFGLDQRRVQELR
jgi:Lon protease-like protein